MLSLSIVIGNVTVRKTKQKIQQSRKEIYIVICSFGGELLDEFERKKKIFFGARIEFSIPSMIKSHS